MRTYILAIPERNACIEEPSSGPPIYHGETFEEETLASQVEICDLALRSLLFGVDSVSLPQLGTLSHNLALNTTS